ncbi:MULTISPECIES: deoxyribose-phosphate aldolase [Fischerella]|jgi:deoxyribose-phosphate aldolase|uniref:Deoxyribose-phosphate aldolase n=4 Tax=Fischerella TaxID=1190 RepID=G6FQ25_9CYAN|nr:MULTISPECIES: deoxyribose-phosphate aldolase [Fischerella]PMB01849.1 deoxyribose-phosphate aldolase [Fischerella thermalis CCMEE 5328]PMB04166.1 deoxyribose-phosphate aldolase [Fischerella thermalis CCMEE 5196]PMB05610.1 2-deoxyribose-5-phosphate aldolase [Fischerella thermalis CCMEE 5273]BCX10861.1 MAG: deoxyribose-phosphate aldolase [Fischerella sp.]EHC17910.1 Deoxyribose-phosphate aldolase [Fischerella thermalis JSC-11]
MAAEYPDNDIDIAPYIDHTLLIPTATPDLIEQWCEEAQRFHFAGVCVNPSYVRLAAELLHNKMPKICTVIGFPTGATTSAVKLYEAQEAVENGANELDVVINLGWLKAGKTDEVHREIAEICEETGQIVKVIIETNLLTDAEKRLATEICMDAGAAFIKTCTGWNGGATVADVRLLKEVARERVGIKASGGIRTIDQALDLILAGATRLGTSYSVDLLRQRDTLEKSSH